MKDFLDAVKLYAGLALVLGAPVWVVLLFALAAFGDK